MMANQEVASHGTKLYHDLYNHAASLGSGIISMWLSHEQVKC